MINDIVDKLSEAVGWLQTIREHGETSIEDRLLLDQAQLETMKVLADVAKTSLFTERIRV